MKIRITDIPSEGRDFEFELSAADLNERLRNDQEVAEKGSLLPPEYQFKPTPKVELHVDVRGTTVFFRGNASGEYSTICSHCGEEIVKALSADINLVLKPLSGREHGEEAVDDLQLSYYEGKEIDCAHYVEDFLLLAIPYRVTCDDVETCENNLSVELVEDAEQGEVEKPKDPRLAILSKIKLH